MSPWYVLARDDNGDDTDGAQRAYGPGSAERKGLVEALTQMEKELPFEVPCIVNGKPVRTAYCSPVPPHTKIWTGQDRQPREAAYPLGPREAPLLVPRSGRGDRQGRYRGCPCGEGRMGGHALERQGRDLPQGGGPCERKVSLQAHGCDHARPGKERMAGRDRCCC